MDGSAQFDHLMNFCRGYPDSQDTKARGENLTLQSITELKTYISNVLSVADQARNGGKALPGIYRDLKGEFTFKGCEIDAKYELRSLTGYYSLSEEQEQAARTAFAMFDNLEREAKAALGDILQPPVSGS